MVVSIKTSPSPKDRIVAKRKPLLEVEFVLYLWKQRTGAKHWTSLVGIPPEEEMLSSGSHGVKEELSWYESFAFARYFQAGCEASFQFWCQLWKDQANMRGWSYYLLLCLLAAKTRNQTTKIVRHKAKGFRSPGLPHYKQWSFKHVIGSGSLFGKGTRLHSQITLVICRLGNAFALLSVLQSHPLKKWI